MDSSKINFIQKHHIKRLYVRFFDVVRDADGEIMPNATLQFDTTEENMTADVFIINWCENGAYHYSDSLFYRIACYGYRSCIWSG